MDPWRPHACFLEDEPDAAGELVRIATVFLTNRECPWRCVMCDLWRYALAETLPLGAIPRQIDHALDSLKSQTNASSNGGPPRLARQIKLYNAGSFFDPRAIPPADYPPIAARVRAFERVIVECHPALVGQSCLRFRDLLAAGHPGGQLPKLEIAVGLEVAHPDVLKKLNKGMSLDQFRRAAEFLQRHGIALRVFVLVQPPFLEPAEAGLWAKRSIDFAFACGATVLSLIPTRGGNGALETLAAHGNFVPPKLDALEAALEYGMALRRGRVFADLWDLEKFANCPVCAAPRAARLREMNLCQTVLPSVRCDACRPGPAPSHSPTDRS
ncbi:MAG: radical SAM protein [Verrucomicrobia bacterium]|nr:radical SAM protein [Verrucomicrobiota bacterium]